MAKCHHKTVSKSVVKIGQFNYEESKCSKCGKLVKRSRTDAEVTAENDEE